VRKILLGKSLAGPGGSAPVGKSLAVCEERFREKYWAKDVKKCYSGFDVAVRVEPD
jgi:hypothetical protein